MNLNKKVGRAKRTWSVCIAILIILIVAMVAILITHRSDKDTSIIHPPITVQVTTPAALKGMPYDALTYMSTGEGDVKLDDILAPMGLSNFVYPGSDYTRQLKIIALGPIESNCVLLFMLPDNAPSIEKWDQVTVDVAIISRFDPNKTSAVPAKDLRLGGEVRRFADAHRAGCKAA